MYQNYMNPYLNPATQPTPLQGVLPPQQIITAKGKNSISNIRMSPNSSVLIADEDSPIIWKCVSDGLGNVTSEAWDITPHKDPEQRDRESLLAIVTNMNERLKRLEENYEKSNSKWSTHTSTEQHAAEPENGKANVGSYKKSPRPSGNDTRNAEE